MLVLQASIWAAQCFTQLLYVVFTLLLNRFCKDSIQGNVPRLQSVVCCFRVVGFRA